jgi:hypothetical protein
MPGLAFISYRRDDAGSEAQGLYLQLKGRFGSGQLFMDVNSVPVGSPWPQRVKDKLLKATVVLAMIGPGWLTASDQYGRRRLDFPDDWVHLELATALVRGTPIIPVVVGHKFPLRPPMLYRMSCRDFSSLKASCCVRRWQRGRPTWIPLPAS